ncbi:mutarotase [Adhaeribacter swui]|uniref:Mutarotase n=1 Tax=Adhaeribacter swui TaxID=2086471 RepID=A0A7G7GEI4_9BACT|nr:2'-5' RNA ligase family protein [Adhaeribacter swui]QNF35568.1 mutarotase [Adhaeribacter swui]
MEAPTHLKEHYQQLYNRSISKIQAGQVEVDESIDSPDDNRRGITLLIRPPDYIKSKIQDFLHILRAVAPEQYYYRQSDMHVTVMSLISCYPGFSLDKIAIADYVAIIQKSLANTRQFEINFKGIMATPASVLIQGFLHEPTLNDLRDQLRQNFKNSTLEQTIDKRYSIQTAHATVVRFRKKLSHSEAFADLLEQYRHYNFGTFPVESLELVYNDWYQRQEKVRLLHVFKLPG